MTRHDSKDRHYLPILAVVLVACSVWGIAQKVSRAAQANSNVATNALTPAEVKEGWKLLFDGKTMNGWKPLGDAPWGVEDGTISVTIGPSVHGDLLTTASYGNFDLKVDFWTEKHNSNSGVYLRCTQTAEGKWTWYEVNISDASDAFPTGSIVNMASTLPDFRADSFGKWNTMEMIAQGDHFIVELNGKQTVDAHDSKLTVAGPIGLQGGGSGIIRFRNLKIRTLDK